MCVWDAKIKNIFNRINGEKGYMLLLILIDRLLNFQLIHNI